MKRLLMMAGAGSLILAVLLVGSAWFVDSQLSRDVRFVVPHEPDVVEFQKALYLEGDPVPEIYGVPADNKSRVVMPDPQKIIVPEEDETMTLMTVNKQKGENPLQVKTVWFGARWAVIVLGIVALAGFTGAYLVGRRSRS